MSILTSSILTEAILPFVLVFVLVFAVLQKSKVLGEGKNRIDALIALVIGLMTIVVAPARDFIVGIMPWLAIGLAVILVFLLLYGFVAGDLKTSPKWLKIVFGILAGIFVLVVVIGVSGFWPTLKDFLSNGLGGETVSTIIFLVIIIAAVLVVVLGGGKKAGA